MNSPAHTAVDRPAALALGLVRLGSRVLPPADRQRYRWEFVADLHHLDRPHQLSYATGVLSTAWTLRQQLTKEPAVNDTSTTPTIVRSNLKRFTICKVANHNWARIAYPPTSDGEAAGTFLRCQRCGKENHDAGTNARGAGGLAAGGGIGGAF